MSELLKNAWIGWQDFIDAGKLVALLGASLLFLRTVYRRKTQSTTLLIYTGVMAVLCVIPFTAVGLMLYQTKFYDYQWIWSVVPMTAVIAYGAVCFLTEYWTDFKRTEWKKGFPVLILLLAVLILSSGLGKTSADAEKDMTERRVAENVLAQVQEEMQEADICLWAPREIMEYARETDGSIRLLYGRNMWDIWLNAYSYDTYSEEITKLYEWMEAAALTGQDRAAAEQIETAIEAGVNCILLPESMNPGLIRRLERTLQLRAVSINGYYLLIA